MASMLSVAYVAGRSAVGSGGRPFVPHLKAGRFQVQGLLSFRVAASLAPHFTVRATRTPNAMPG